MAYTGRFGQSDDFRREELIRIIEHSVENLTLQELEALYYDMQQQYRRQSNVLYLLPLISGYLPLSSYIYLTYET